jgi:glutamyl-tRNA reductase
LIEVEGNKAMILCLTANHKKASVPMLESLNFKDRELATKRCCSLESVKEVVILQTCHRVEIYVAIVEGASAQIAGNIMKLWSQEVGVSLDVIEKIVEALYGREALLHLLRLASGLESMVIGEDEVLGQVRTAYVESKRIGAANALLEKAFMKAVNVGRRARSETRINKGSLSVASVAVGLAEGEFGNLKDVRALVVGAGEAGSLVARQLATRGARSIHIANRTFQRSRDLAEKVGGKAIPFADLHNELRAVDLAIFAVSVSEPLLKSEDAKDIMRSRNGRNLMLIDISQPRCVEEATASLAGVDLKNIDDLKFTTEENAKRRLDEAEKVNRIVLDELERLEVLLGRMLAEPLVSALYSKVDRVREQELRKALSMVGNIDGKQKVAIENLSRELVERIIQLPAESLRKAALNNDGALLAAAKRLFELS